MPDPRQLGSRGPRVMLIALPPAALLILVAVALLAGGSGSSAGAASTTTKGTGSATVTRRDLISTDTQSGTLGFGDAETVYNRLSGTITSLPSAGTVIKPGGTLFTVDNAPVVLMNGTLPAYRALSSGVSDGPDVKELEQNLRDLGFDSGHAMTIDNHFDSATTAAVERWQASLGRTQTGAVALGSAVFLPGTRRISSVTASLGSTGGSSGGASTATTASTKPVSRRVFVDLATSVPTSTTSTTSTTTTTSSGTTPTGASTGRPPRRGTPSSGSGSTITSLQALVALLKAETAELRGQLKAAGSGTTKPASPGSSPTGGSGGKSGASAAPSGASAGRSVGGGGSPSGASGASGTSGSSGGSGSSSAAGASAQAVLQTTSTELVATVNLDASKQSEAGLGQPVTVQMPDGSTVRGRISRVAAAAQSSSASSPTSGGSSTTGGSGSTSTTSTVPVTITLSGRRKAAGLDQAAVSVNFQQQKAAGVLAVPVTALLATAGGGYAIQEAGASNRLIPVTTGLFAAGYVQISGSGIDAGLQVTDSQG